MIVDVCKPDRSMEWLSRYKPFDFMLVMNNLNRSQVMKEIKMITISSHINTKLGHSKVIE